MDRHSSIFVAGGADFVGAALVRELRECGFAAVTSEVEARLDLRDRPAVERYFAMTRPRYVFHAAGISGGIHANQTRPAELMADNLAVALNVVHASHEAAVTKLLYLASSCSYPREATQPLRPEQLLTGALEPTNEPYALAKLAGVKLCQSYRRQYGDDFVVGIPSNPFGPGEDTSLEDSHVIPALLRKVHEAKLAGAAEVEIWGSGAPRRDFIYVDDLAAAALTVMERYSSEVPINLGRGHEISIRALAEEIVAVVGFAGALRFDTSRSDGMPLKLLDAEPLAALGWKPRFSFRQALEHSYQDFVARAAAQEIPA